MADKIVRAEVVGNRPVFGTDAVLYLPGEFAPVNLDVLGVKELGDKTPGLKKASTSAEEPVDIVPIAAVAAHAPDAPNAQGIPPGTVQSGTGRLVKMRGAPDSTDVKTTEYVGADATILDATGESLTPAKPTKGK